MPSGNSPQRTAEDRERARAERERRRQAPQDATEHAAAPVAATNRVEAEMPLPAPPPLAIPAPAPLPARIPPPGAVGRRATLSSPRRWPARLSVGVGLALVLAALAVAVAFVLHDRSHKAKPPPTVSIVRVTIPEGETRAQIARIAAAKGLRGSYLEASRHSGLLNPARYGAPHGTHSLEGFLFPATYELFDGAAAGRLVELQLAAFHENFTSTQARLAHTLHIAPYELLIVASMVEREALLASDRARVAAVIYNRLRLGMPLGIDSTIRYALHDYTEPLTEAQLQIDSPYNTRTHKGLPPTPISNPGLAAIDAAAHPAHVSYLYYVNGADGCGELVFSNSNAQFERDAAAYREAIAHHGGRVPTCRKR